MFKIRQSISLTVIFDDYYKIFITMSSIGFFIINSVGIKTITGDCRRIFPTISLLQI